MKKHVDIRVSGLVQGVFFRASTRETAGHLGITGLVRNEPDGTVYIEAEGDEDNIREFIAWCRKGPRQAQVGQCEVSEGILKNFERFEIQR